MPYISGRLDFPSPQLFAPGSPRMERVMCVREELRENFHTLLKQAYFFTINIIIIIIIVIIVIVPSKARCEGIK